MIAAPWPTTPALGPLAPPSEQEAVSSYAELRDHALTLSWAAVALGKQVAQLEGLVRSGALLAVPGPWSMRQMSQPGYFVPAWQFAPGARELQPGLEALLSEAAAAGWTSLDLHRFMTAPDGTAGTTPARLLREEGVAPVLALMRSDGAMPSLAAHRRRRPQARLHPPRLRPHAGVG
jgi:hypothetical protein